MSQFLMCIKSFVNSPQVSSSELTHLKPSQHQQVQSMSFSYKYLMRQVQGVSRLLLPNSPKRKGMPLARTKVWVLNSFFQNWSQEYRLQEGTPQDQLQKCPVQTNLLGTDSSRGKFATSVRSSWQLIPLTKINQCGLILSTFQAHILAALLQSFLGSELPHCVSSPLAFLSQFLRSIPITKGFFLYLQAKCYAHSKNMYSGYSLLHQSPSPSSLEQHHWDLDVWLLRITISPHSVSTLMVWSNTSMALLPLSSGLAEMNFSGMTLSSQNIWREQVSLMQFILNLFLMSRAISLRGRHSSPSTQCLAMWAPDQLVPASLTLLPVLSTMAALLVLRGNMISKGSEIVFFAWKCSL